MRLSPRAEEFSRVLRVAFDPLECPLERLIAASLLRCRPLESMTRRRLLFRACNQYNLCYIL
jgi:hypothetical protein